MLIPSNSRSVKAAYELNIVKPISEDYLGCIKKRSLLRGGLHSGVYQTIFNNSLCMISGLSSQTGLYLRGCYLQVSGGNLVARNNHLPYSSSLFLTVLNVGMHFPAIKIF